MGIPVLTPVNLEGYSELYSITENGEVWSNRKGKFIAQSYKDCGYPTVQLWNNKKVKLISVHRLVALTFIPNPHNYPFINHKDENKSNSSVDNLEWCTAKYNINYGSCIERIKQSNQKHYCSERWKEIARENGKKVSRPVTQLTKEGEIVAHFPSSAEAGRQCGLNSNHILECCRGQRYKTVGGYVWKYTERV